YDSSSCCSGPGAVSQSRLPSGPAMQPSRLMAMKTEQLIVPVIINPPLRQASALQDEVGKQGRQFRDLAVTDLVRRVARSVVISMHSGAQGKGRHTSLDE